MHLLRAALLFASTLGLASAQDPEPTPLEHHGLELGAAAEVVFDSPQLVHHFVFRTPPDPRRLDASREGVLVLRILATPEVHRPHGRWRVQGSEAWQPAGALRAQTGRDYELELRCHTDPNQAKASGEPVELRVDWVPTPEEPDGLDDPRPLAPGEEVELTLLPQGDRDYFRLTLPADGVLRATVLEKPPEHGPNFTWRRAGEAQPFRDREWDAWAAKGTEVVLEVRSHYYSWDERGSAGKVRLRVDFVPEPFPGEPDTQPQEAVAAELGEPFGVMINPRLDRDYRRFTAPGRGVLNLRTLAKPEAIQGPYPTWHSAESGAQLRDGEWDLRVEPGQQVVLGVRAARYSWDERAADEPLELQVDFVAEPFPGEPDDDPQHARQVEVGEVVGLAIMPRREHDHLRVTAPGVGTLELVVLERPPEHQVYVTWLDAAGKPVREGERDRTVSEGEQATVSIRGARYSWDERASASPIRVRVDFKLSRDEHEPNDSLAEAKPLRPGQDVSVTFAPRRDQDWFRYTPAQDAVLTLAPVTIPAGQHPALLWFDGDGKELGGQRSLWVPGGEPVFVQLRAAYYSWDERVWTEPLTVRFEVRETSDAFEPNDDVAEGAPLKPGRRLRAELIPGDIDVFRLSGEAGTTGFEARLESAPGVAPPRLEWLDRSGGVLGEGPRLEQPRREVWLRVTPGSPEGGRYALQVLQQGGDLLGAGPDYPRLPPPLRAPSKPSDLEGR